MLLAGALARRSDNTVWGWNFTGNFSGVLPRLGLPAPTGPLTALVAGPDHVVALRGGQVITWGSNQFGQLGIDDPGDRVPLSDPVVAIGGTVGIGSGSDHGLATDANGDVWAWGRNVPYQLGDGTTTQRNASIRVPGINLH